LFGELLSYSGTESKEKVHVVKMKSGVADVEEIRLGGIGLRFLIDGPSSGAGVTMFEMTVAPGAGMPVPHHHVGFDESGYGVSGRLKFMLEGESIDVGAGDLVWIERGKVHGFTNPFDEPAVVLCTITPGLLGAEYFREIRELLSGGGPPDPKAMGAVMLKHGLVPVKVG
jgi:quercetin dioxygenase-like cupin family protein